MSTAGWSGLSWKTATCSLLRSTASAYWIRTSSGGEGSVTSGNLSPVLETGIGMAYVAPPPDFSTETIEVEIRNRWVAGRLARPPFHKE